MKSPTPTGASAPRNSARRPIALRSSKNTSSKVRRSTWWPRFSRSAMLSRRTRSRPCTTSIQPSKWFTSTFRGASALLWHPTTVSAPAPPRQVLSRVSTSSATAAQKTFNQETRTNRTESCSAGPMSRRKSSLVVAAPAASISCLGKALPRRRSSDRQGAESASHPILVPLLLLESMADRRVSPASPLSSTKKATQSRLQPRLLASRHSRQAPSSSSASPAAPAPAQDAGRSGKLFRPESAPIERADRSIVVSARQELTRRPSTMKNSPHAAKRTTFVLPHPCHRAASGRPGDGDASAPPLPMSARATSGRRGRWHGHSCESARGAARDHHVVSAPRGRRSPPPPAH
mmetsp:Transcript_106711/g.302302  ORF Transcript_106711/g.302302 Transcript_106711/m.302302 type:complete len:347 (-) Transcript_106711:18-1058(-)